MKLEVDLSPTIEQQLTEVACRVWEETMQREVEKRNYPDWMDIGTTCDYLQVSRTTLSGFIDDLEFPISTINQTKRCNRKKVDEWMSQFEN